jgi:CRISPR-associated protein Cmr6
MTQFPNGHHSDYEAVPMEYRAQINNRCSRQFPKSGHASQWVKEWLKASGSKPRYSDQTDNPLFRTLKIQIDWRLVSNSGIDEGIIRPVIGAGGWPLIPGSSIKGLFRRACQRLHADKLKRWCGRPPVRGEDGGGSNGILRFHGAWPTDEKWKHRLLDIVHGQQRWQVWDPDRDPNPNHQGWKRRIQHNANAIISLYRPELIIPISTSSHSISNEEWNLITATLQVALAQGIGGRTCAGYGSIVQTSDADVQGDMPVIFRCDLAGQGVASTLLFKEQGEFRPNIFRAALRGMTLRLLGGLCSSLEAKKETGRLFGSINKFDGGLKRGLLESRFIGSDVAIKQFSSGDVSTHVFAVTGTLQWHFTTDKLPSDQQKLLADLLASLHGITYCLAGFGRSWRRPDHRIFYPDYYKNNPRKPAIGCHWQSRELSIGLTSSIETLHPESQVSSRNKEGLVGLIQQARTLAKHWLALHGVRCNRELATWRDIIHESHMLIWARHANGPSDAKAIRWFHAKPNAALHGNMDPRDLKDTSIGGYLKKDKYDPRDTEVSRIWNRMLPCVLGDSLPDLTPSLDSSLNTMTASITPWPNSYLELLVLFSDRHGMDADPTHQAELIKLLDEPDSPFGRVRF